MQEIMPSIRISEKSKNIVNSQNDDKQGLGHSLGFQIRMLIAV